MAPANQAVLFAINNTPNRYEAAALADRLGASVVEATPKVFFPPDWVLEYAKGPVAKAIFAVTYCNDQETLTEIATRERRITVLLALAKNQHLTNATYEAMLARASDTQRRDLETAHREAKDLLKTPQERVGDLLEDPATFQFGRQRSLGSFLTTLREHIALDPKAIDQVLRSEPPRGHQLASAFLQNYYATPGYYDDIWEHVSISPRQVLDLHEDASKARMLTDLIQTCARTSAQRRPLDAEIAELLLRAPASPPQLGGREPLRQLFSSEAVDIIITSAAWTPVLALQCVDDAQFTAILTTLPPSAQTKLLYPLGSDRRRLEVVLDALVTSTSGPVLGPRDWERAVHCLEGNHDPLIDKLLQLSDSEAAFAYVSGNYTVRNSEDEGTRLLPTKEQVISIVSSHSGLERSWRGFSKYVSEGKYTTQYAHTLLDYVPGLYAALLNDPTFTGYLYDTLVATGADSTQIIDHLETGRTLSLFELCETLRNLPR